MAVSSALRLFAGGGTGSAPARASSANVATAATAVADRQRGVNAFMAVLPITCAGALGRKQLAPRRRAHAQKRSASRGACAHGSASRRRSHARWRRIREDPVRQTMATGRAGPNHTHPGVRPIEAEPLWKRMLDLMAKDAAAGRCRRLLLRLQGEADARHDRAPRAFLILRVDQIEAMRHPPGRARKVAPAVVDEPIAFQRN